jgi:hypothetical protein
MNTTKEKDVMTLKKIKAIEPFTISIFILMLLSLVINQQRTLASDIEEMEAVVIVNPIGEPCYFLEVDEEAPYVVENVTMIPLRALAEVLGYKVNFDDQERSVIIARDDEHVVLFLDTNRVLINDDEDFMLHKPIVRHGRTFIPLRYITEFFGYHVYWQLNTSYVYNYMDVWVSQLPLLEMADVELDENFEAKINGGYSYSLRSGGVTQRGAMVGDTSDTIIELYGEPHREEFDGYYTIFYYSTISHPLKTDGIYLAFSLLNNRVEEIHLIFGD